MVIILMGVSGSGKTTVGEALAAALGYRFEDADGYHPPENVEKMRQAIPLTEADRQPWLQALREAIEGWVERGEGVVLACSALTAGSREKLGVDRPGVRLVHLTGSMELIRDRLDARRGHYMPADLLASQFETLEPPERAIVVDIAPGPDTIVDRIRERLDV